jgi:branched-chain amino acid transport system substrate-binding protein
MRGSTFVAAILAASIAGVGVLGAQEAPPSAPPEREGYGGTPDEVAPFRGVEPARRFFVEPQLYRGPGRDDPPPADLDRVVIGLITPLSGYDAVAGRRIREAVGLAIDRANAEGGFGDAKLPFAAVVRDEGARWGQAGDALVDLVDEDGAWAVLGGYEDANSHVVSRVVLKVQVANVNTSGTDPTLTEHNIPWVLRNRPDDRQTAIRLLRKVYREDGRKRAILFRANDRYGRTGVKEFVDAARRHGHPVPLETRYDASETDWASRIERIRAAKPDAVVLWGRPGPTGAALRALREAGIDLPCYGPDRLVDPRFLAEAGKAAEGFTFTYPFDPASCGAEWEAFRAAYRQRTGEEPLADAAYAYDGTRMIVAAIREAGLNRARIMDALNARTTFVGVTGTARFDVTMNNVSKMTIGRVEIGRFVIGK